MTRHERPTTPTVGEASPLLCERCRRDVENTFSLYTNDKLSKPGPVWCETCFQIMLREDAAQDVAKERQP